MPLALTAILPEYLPGVRIDEVEAPANDGFYGLVGYVVRQLICHEALNPKAGVRTAVRKSPIVSVDRSARVMSLTWIKFVKLKGRHKGALLSVRDLAALTS